MEAVEFTSDPEYDGAGNRARRIGRSVTNNRATSRLRVGKRRESPPGARRAEEAADPRDTRHHAMPDEKGAGEGRRQSAGSRLGAMLRRGTPTLTNLRSYSTSKIHFRGSQGKNFEPKTSALSSMTAMDDLELPSIGGSPPLKLDDPPNGRFDFKSNGDDTRGADTSRTSRRVSIDRGKSAAGVNGSGDGGSTRSGSAALGVDRAAQGGDGLGGDGASRRRSTRAQANNKDVDSEDGGGVGHVGFWSGSDVGGEQDRRGRPLSAATAPALAGASGRRDRSAPPFCRASLGSGDAQSPPESVDDVLPNGAQGAAGGGELDGEAMARGERTRGDDCDEEQKNAEGAAASESERGGRGSMSSISGSRSTSVRKHADADIMMFGNFHPPGFVSTSGSALAGAASAPTRGGGAGTNSDHRERGLGANGRHKFDGSTTAAYPAANEHHHMSRRRAADGGRTAGDGYVSAPDGSRDARRIGDPTLEVDVCIARAEAALFATDASSSSGTRSSSYRRPAEMVGEGGGQYPQYVAGGFIAGRAGFVSVGPGAAAAAVLDTGAAAPSARRNTTSTRRKLAELLHFRRRSTTGGSGDGSPPPFSSYKTSASYPRPAKVIAGAIKGSGAGDAGHRDGSEPPRAVAGHSHRSSGSAPSVLSSLDGFNPTGGQEEESSTSAANEYGVRVGGGIGDDGNTVEKEAGPRRGRVAARRLLSGRSSSTPALGESASPQPKRHRESFLEAGKHTLRRGRSMISRSSFSGGASHRSRPVVQTEASSEERGMNGEDQDGVEGIGVHLTMDGSVEPLVEPKKEGPPVKPQLGTTYVRRSRSAPIESDTAAPWNTWGGSRASEFRVRTKGYGRTKVKAPSAPELYELASIDAYRSPAGRLCGVYPLFAPPACLAEATAPKKPSLAPRRAGTASERLDGGDNGSAGRVDPAGQSVAGDKVLEGGLEGQQGETTDRASFESFSSRGSTVDTGHPDIPPVFVVNCQLPDVPTPFSVQGDGPTVHVIFTFRATGQLCRYAARMAAEERAAATGEPLSSAATAAAAEKVPGTATATPPACTVGTAHGKRVTSALAEASVTTSPISTAAAECGDSRAAENRGSPREGELDCSASRGGHGLRDSVQGVTGGGEGAVREEDTEERDESVQVPESVRLLAEWVRRAADDATFRGRFKAIGDIINADEVGLPSIARRFSGKPILVYGKESSVVKGEGFTELDLNAHAFSYIGRKGLYVTLDKWKTAIFRIGFLIEGRTDEEQPEHMLGCGILKGLDMSLLTELSLSPDGERLVVTNSDDLGSAEGSDEEYDTSANSISVREQDTENTGFRAVRSGGNGGVGRARARTSASPPSSTLDGLWSGVKRCLRGSTVEKVGVSASSRVPLLPRGRVDLLLRSGNYAGNSGSSSGGVNGAVFYEKASSFGETADKDGDTVTVTVVAAAAFAGGWFCALLVIVTIACWSELTVAGDGMGAEQSQQWRRGVSAWLVRVFTDS